MTTWAGVVDYIKSNYKIMEEKDNLLKLGFNLDDLRSQAVYMWRFSLMDGEEEWIQIESPFAHVDSVDAREVLKATESNVCGGIGLSGDYLTVRHAAPIANLDINELERPMMLVTFTADALERQFVGQDVF